MWKDQGMGVSKALDIIREGMLRWWRRKLMRYFFSVIKANLVSMEEFWNHPRGKGLGRKLYMDRQSTVSTHRG